MTDHMYISPAIFDRTPRLGYGFLGFCDGRTGRPADPPKGEHRAAYMAEYRAGLAQRGATETTP